MTPEQLVQSLRKEASSILMQTVVGTALVAAIVAGLNFGHAFLSIDDLTFADLDHVVVVGRHGSGIPFWPMFWLSMIVVPGIVGAINLWRYLRAAKRAKRLTPIVERGTAEPARIVEARSSHEKRGNMQYERLTVVAETQAGQRHQAMKEVTVGTALPEVATSAEASVITYEGHAVVVVGAEVFEAASPR